MSFVKDNPNCMKKGVKSFKSGGVFLVTVCDDSIISEVTELVQTKVYDVKSIDVCIAIGTVMSKPGKWHRVDAIRPCTQEYLIGLQFVDYCDVIFVRMIILTLKLSLRRVPFSFL